MIKFKRLPLIAVMTVAALIALGNWVTPVQANSADIATPTPTGTPIVQPESSGEAVSAEQQEELKI